MIYQFTVDDTQNFLGAISHGKLETNNDKDAFRAIVRASGFSNNASDEDKKRWEANPYVFTLPDSVDRKQLDRLVKLTGAGSYTEHRAQGMKP